MGLGSFSGRQFRRAKNAVGDAYYYASGDNARDDAARALKHAKKEAQQYQKEAKDTQLELNEPWRQTGLKALSDLAGGDFNFEERQFGEQQPGDFVDNTQMPAEYTDSGHNFQADPGYAFRKAEAEKQMLHSAAARGGLFSGSTLSALSDRIGNMASEEFGNSYGRYQDKRNFGYGQNQDMRQQANINRGFKYGQYQDKLGQFNTNRNVFAQGEQNRRQGMNDRFSRLSTLAGFGENATTRGGQAAGMYGQQAGDNTIGLGNADAANIISSYNSKRDIIMGGLDAAAKAKGEKAGGK